MSEIRKANPTDAELHISAPLTNVSVAWFQANQGKYRAGGIFPAVGVMKQYDKYYTYDRGDLLRSQAQDRAPGAEAPVGGYRVSTDNYVCDRKSLAVDVSDPDRANADPQFDLDMEAAEFITDQIELAKEVSWITDFFTTAIWDGASSSTDMTGQAAPASTTSNFRQWNDAASTPIEDIRGEIYSIESGSGYRPNKLILGPNVWRSLADHPDIVDRIKSGLANPSRATLAALLEVDEIVVLGGVRNTSVEQAADSISYLAGKHALLAYVTPSPGLRRPTAGYQFVWTGSGVPLGGARMKRFRLERNESDRIEGETWFDFKQVASDLGAFFASAVA